MFLRTSDDRPDDRLERGIVSASVGVRCGLSEAARPRVWLEDELRIVPDRFRTRRIVDFLLIGDPCGVANGDSTSASSEAVAVALTDASGAGNTSSRIPACCGVRRFDRGELASSSTSSESDDGEGDALCTRDWRNRTKRECANERDANRITAGRMLSWSSPRASRLSSTIDCIGYVCRGTYCEITE